MLRPTTGELLHGVCEALEAHVLPATPSGLPARQLKASLHILRRLERAWDRLPAHLAADNADLSATLRALLAELERSDAGAGGFAELAAQLRALSGARLPARAVDQADPPGGAATVAPPVLHDPVCAHAVARNEALHGLLERVDAAVRREGALDVATRARATAKLTALYQRMLARQGWADATDDDTDGVM